MINLFEYKNKASLDEEHFEDLEMFLDSVWNKREKTAYYTEEENREEVQRFLQFFHRTNELKSNKYVGVIHFQNQCKRMKFNPLFSHFETVRDYCILFLENSISFNYKNELKLFAFLLPMEYVFEDFIYGFIDREIEGINPKGQVSGVYLDEDKTFNLKPDLILDLGFKKVIADTKYKLVYSNDSDPKCCISQSDLYQMVSYAIRFSINEVKLLYPANIANTFLGDFNIKIKDTLADGKEIEISAHQLPIIDMNLTSAEIKTHQSFINSFEKLKNELIKRLVEIFKS